MADVILEVKKLRDEGLTDSLIMEELTKQGVPPDQRALPNNHLRRFLDL